MIAGGVWGTLGALTYRLLSSSHGQVEIDKRYKDYLGIVYLLYDSLGITELQHSLKSNLNSFSEKILVIRIKRSHRQDSFCIHKNSQEYDLQIAHESLSEVSSNKRVL